MKQINDISRCLSPDNANPNQGTDVPRSPESRDVRLARVHETHRGGKLWKHTDQ